MTQLSKYFIFSVTYFVFFFSFLFFKILKYLILTCIPKHEPPSHSHLL